MRILKKTLRPKSIDCISQWSAFDVLAVPNLGVKSLFAIMQAGEMAGVRMKDDQVWCTYWLTGVSPFYPYTTHKLNIPPLTQQRYLKWWAAHWSVSTDYIKEHMKRYGNEIETAEGFDGLSGRRLQTFLP